MIKHPRTGFTIVELLIVIVVIGILAAVTVVSFNGLTARAENLKTVNGITTFMKALQVYYADNNTYPISSWPCVGAVPTNCGVISNGLGCWGVGYVSASSTLNNAILTVSTTVPEVSKQTMTCNTDGSKAVGSFYSSVSPGNTYLLYYFLKGDVLCGTPSGKTFSKSFSVQTTLCSATISAS